MNKATSAAPADLSIFDTQAACDKGFELELVHPVTKNGTGVFITVVGKDSKAHRDHIRASANENLRRNFQRQRKGKDADAPRVEEIEAEAIGLLVACTTAWRNLILPGSTEPLEFNEENCRKVYTDFPAIRSQVDEAIADLENFISA